MFIRNTWYPCAWSNEIGRTLFERWVCNIPMVFYRTEAGAPVALNNRCAHRRAPLSKGQLLGDRVQCGYHGLEFDCTGKCVRIPGQDQIPEQAGVRSYPVVDRWRFLWVWPGDPEKADPALIPDLHWNDSPGWVSPGDTLTIDCDWLLDLDNLMDLSHLTYLHGRTIGTPYVSEFPAVTEVVGDRVRVTRWMIDRAARRPARARLRATAARASRRVRSISSRRSPTATRSISGRTVATTVLTTRRSPVRSTRT